jgi:hypothetical protein
MQLSVVLPPSITPKPSERSPPPRGRECGEAPPTVWRYELDTIGLRRGLPDDPLRLVRGTLNPWSRWPIGGQFFQHGAIRPPRNPRKHWGSTQPNMTGPGSNPGSGTEAGWVGRVGSIRFQGAGDPALVAFVAPGAEGFTTFGRPMGRSRAPNQIGVTGDEAHRLGRGSCRGRPQLCHDSDRERSHLQAPAPKRTCRCRRGRAGRGHSVEPGVAEGARRARRANRHRFIPPERWRSPSSPCMPRSKAS